MMRCAPVWLCLCLLGLVEAQLLDLFEDDVCKEENGKKWTCKKMADCPKFREDLAKKIRPTTCAFVNSKPLICCEPTKKIVGAKSKQMCEKYGESIYVNVIDPYTGKYKKIHSCVTVEPLISGGENAQPREYPHMALIGYGEESNKQWLCGGSLISDRYVLSAAHCTDAGFNGLARWARLGEYNIKLTTDDDIGDAQPVDYEITERINHPDYRSVVYNDIALYKLKDTVQFNEYIRPICLNAERQLTRSFAIATGWGRLEQSGRRGEILQKVNVTFTLREKCSEYYPADEKDLKSGLDGDTMMCAGNLHNIGDTCKGDSGGPLQIPLKELTCMYTQVGITSFGGICGVGRPAVYARVSHFLEWIEGIVWP